MLRTGRQSDFRDPCFTDPDLLDVFRSLSVHPLGRAPMGATFYSRAQPGFGRTLTTTPRNLYLISIMIAPVPGGEMWRDQRSFHRGYIPAGGIAVLDHRSEWSALPEDPFALFDLFIPVSAIDQVAREAGRDRIATLHCPLEQTNVDPVMFHLAMSLMPLVRGELPSTLLFVEHVFQAITLHLARAYGGLAISETLVRGGLPPFLYKRAQDMLLSDLTTEPSLSELAQACGLSSRHFTRAFKAGSGEPPHRWLLRRKVDRAKELLRIESMPIADIALLCGFADQSHFTRIFRRVIGSSPAAWRRMVLN